MGRRDYTLEVFQERGQGAALPPGGRLVGMVPRIAFHFFAEDHGFGNFFHGAAFLAALTLESEVSLLFGKAEFALQNAFGALDELAGFELLGKVGIFALEAGHLNLGANEESDGGDELNLALGVNVRL